MIICEYAFKISAINPLVEFKENEDVKTKCFNYFQEYIRNCQKKQWHIALIMVGIAVFGHEFQCQLWVFVT
jgi:hypothetical protein